METTEGLEIGQIVKSKAGRDRGRVMMILEIVDENYVLAVDGDTRRLDKAKKKKIKHLIVYNIVLKEVRQQLLSGGKVNNAFIRKELKPYCEDNSERNGG